MKKVTILSELRAQADIKADKLQMELDQILRVRECLIKLRMSQLSFRVIITSAWHDHGGKDVDVTIKDSLQAAMEQAIARFMEVNRSRDVQGNYIVTAIVPGEPVTSFVLPESYWEDWKWKK